MFGQRLGSKEKGERARLDTQNILQATRVEPVKRTDEQVDHILSFVKNVKFFTKLNVAQQRALCRTLTIEEFAPQETVFEIGDFGHKFYIILEGIANVQMPSQSNPDARETVSKLDRGVGFGELALQDNSCRSATIQASDHLTLLVMTKGDYDRHAGDLHRQFIEQRVQFLRRCTDIETALRQQQFSLADIKHMADCLTEQSLSGNTVICKQGDMADKVVFIRSGNLSVMRSIEIDDKGRCAASAHDDGDEVESRAASKRGSQPWASSTNPEHDDEDDTPKPGNWRKLQLLTKTGASMNKALEQRLSQRNSTQDCPSSKSFEHFKDVQDKRKQYAEWHQNRAREARVRNAEGRRDKVKKRIAREEEELATNQQKVGTKHVANSKDSSKLPFIPQAPRSSATGEKLHTTILRVGQIGAFRYYGDQAVLRNDAYNVTLMSDPICEVYVLSMDIMRRLPKKLLTAFFNQEHRYQIPTDQQLLKTMRLGDRWNSIKSSMSLDLAGRRKGAVQISGLPRSFREVKANTDSAARHKANMEFMGVTPSGASNVPVLPSTQPAGRDLEYFAEPTSQMLKRVHELKDDSALQRRILRDGGQARLSQTDWIGNVGKKLPNDALAIHAKKFWDKFQPDQFELDLEEIEDADLFDSFVKPSIDNQQEVEDVPRDEGLAQSKSLAAGQHNVQQKRRTGLGAADSQASRGTPLLPSISESHGSASAASQQKKSTAYLTQPSMSPILGRTR